MNKTKLLKINLLKYKKVVLKMVSSKRPMKIN